MLTIISTDYWTRAWFEQLVLPTSRYAAGAADIEFLDISSGTEAEHIAQIVHRRASELFEHP